MIRPINSTQIVKYNTNFKAILAVDFDQTICMSEWPTLGMQRKEAGNTLRLLALQGYGIIINTCREGLALADAINWLHQNNIPYHFINCNFPHVMSMYGTDCRKISADVYIDDKCLTGLPSWGDIYKILEKKYGEN